MIKLLLIFIFGILSQVSCQVQADNVPLIQKGKDEISDLYLKHVEEKKLKNGNTSILYKFGKYHSCRVEFDKKNNIVDSECNIDNEKRSDDRLTKIFERIKEDMTISGYCAVKLKNKNAPETVKNRCLYAEYILLSNCSDNNSCLDYREWYIKENHNK